MTALGNFAGKRVLVTGHTGFKGAWLARWLLDLGAEVSGIALAPVTQPNLFTLLNLDSHLDHRLIDIRDHTRLAQAIQSIRPEIVFHLAAQPLVRESYIDPKATFDTNVGGTVNLLDAIRLTGSVRACVVVTSDKCYENREWPWGYRESDAMGGHDPYSASKGACELVAASYRRAFLAEAGCNLATARAGNVIGGGDWSKDRIVTDFLSKVPAGHPLVLRNRKAVRPWQHVLEPLSGYLLLASRLHGQTGADFAEGWNFGPSDSAQATVETLARMLTRCWWKTDRPALVQALHDASQPHEAGLLRLDCAKARHRLAWHAVWDLPTTVQMTVDWYQSQLNGADATQLNRSQIAAYIAAANSDSRGWAQNGTARDFAT